MSFFCKSSPTQVQDNSLNLGVGSVVVFLDILNIVVSSGQSSISIYDKSIIFSPLANFLSLIISKAVV